MLWERLRSISPRNSKLSLNSLPRLTSGCIVPYLLKEKLRLVFQCENVAIAKKELDGWIKWAQHCRINVFVELQRKIRRHYDAILATMEHHLSNAVLEATNRKIKLSVYMAYGFRNIDNMIDMIMLRCSDIDVRLPWDYEAA